MASIKEKREKRFRRHARVRSRIFGTSIRPRLSLFRSNRHIWAQLIDDESGKTLVAANDLEIMIKKVLGVRGALVSKVSAEKMGELLAQKAQEKKIKSAVFDRGPYTYHGLIKAVAEGARKRGLKL